jgi:hypothetical protein
MMISISKSVGMLRVSQPVEKRLLESLKNNSCLVCFLSDFCHFGCMVLICACEIWPPFVVSFSWLLDIDFCAASKRINFHYLSHGDASCNPTPASSSHHSKQNVCLSRLGVLLTVTLNGASISLWFWFSLWSPASLSPFSLKVSGLRLPQKVQKSLLFN